MNYTLTISGHPYAINRPIVMGILNLTDDSFYANSRVDINSLPRRVEKMIQDGVDWLDLGAQSTRPGADFIDATVEETRITEAVKRLRTHFPDLILSIDTFRAQVANAALEAGAHIINDISAGSIEPEIISVVAEHKCPYVLMHMQGTPQNMQTAPVYSDVVEDVRNFLKKRIEDLSEKGITEIIVDPGFGFGKTLKHNYDLLNGMHNFTSLGKPILAGLSRKSMVYKALGVTQEDALTGTIFCNTIALSKGAAILRVHDVKEAVDLVKLSTYITQPVSE